MSDIINNIQKFLAPSFIAAGLIMLLWPRRRKKEDQITREEYDMNPAGPKTETERLIMSEEAARMRTERRNTQAAAHKIRLKSMCHDFVYHYNYKPYFSGNNLNRHIAKRFASHYGDRKYSDVSHYNLRHVNRSNPDIFGRYEEELADRWRAS